MYKTGEGRGRRPLNLNPAQARALQARGLRPGAPIALSQMEAAQLGGGAGAAPGLQGANMPRAPRRGKRAPVPIGPVNPDIGANARAIVKSHNKWFKETSGLFGHGATTTADDIQMRLKKILSDQNIKWLENAGPRPTADQRAFALSILSVIFGKKLTTRGAIAQKIKAGGKAPKNTFSVKFDPGGDGKHGSIKLFDKNGKAAGSAAFKGLHDLITQDVTELRDDHKNLEDSHNDPQPGPHHDIYNMGEKAIESNSKLSKEQKEEYKTSLRTVLNRMPDKAAQEIKKNIKEFSFHHSYMDLSVATWAKHPSVIGKVMRGAFSPSLHIMYLDGGDDDPNNAKLKEGLDTTADWSFDNGKGVVIATQAHELFHTINYKGAISSKPPWQDAHQSESKKVGVYAETDHNESFSEFARMLYSGKNTRGSMQHHFPKMYKVFESEGLLPNHFKESGGVDPLPPKQKELFDKQFKDEQGNPIGDGRKSDQSKAPTPAPAAPKAPAPAPKAPTPAPAAPKVEHTPEQKQHVDDFTKLIEQYEKTPTVTGKERAKYGSVGAKEYRDKRRAQASARREKAKGAKPEAPTPKVEAPTPKVETPTPQGPQDRYQKNINKIQEKGGQVAKIGDKHVIVDKNNKIVGKGDTHRSKTVLDEGPKFAAKPTPTAETPKPEPKKEEPKKEEPKATPPKAETPKKTATYKPGSIEHAAKTIADAKHSVVQVGKQYQIHNQHGQPVGPKYASKGQAFLEGVKHVKAETPKAETPKAEAPKAETPAAKKQARVSVDTSDNAKDLHHVLFKSSSKKNREAARSHPVTKAFNAISKVSNPFRQGILEHRLIKAHLEDKNATAEQLIRNALARSGFPNHPYLPRYIETLKKHEKEE